MNQDFLHYDDLDDDFTIFGDNYLFVIAIDNYCNFKIRSNSVNNAENLVNVLVTKYQFEQKNIISLYNEQATKQNITNKFRELSKKIKEDDNLIVFFSGYGFFDDTLDQAYWLPVDAKDIIYNYIEDTNIANFIRLFRARHIFIISEPCLSNSLFSQYRSTFTESSTNRTSRWGITSGKIEPKPDKTVDNKSAFIELIVEYLNINENAELPISVFIHDIKASCSTKFKQIPQGNPLFGVGDEGGEMMLILKKDEKEEWLKTIALDNIEGYQIFLNCFQQSNHEEFAATRIKDLIEEIRWKNVKDENTVWAFSHYLDNYPDGIYLIFAKRKMKLLKENEKWQKALEDNKYTAFIDYKTSYPDGKFVEDANKKIKELKQSEEELRYWEKKQRLRSIEAYNDYLKKYPNGEFAEESKKEMIFLDVLEQRIKKKKTINKRNKQKYTEKDNNEWENTLKLDTLEAYGSYYKKFADGSHIEKAKTKIAELENIIETTGNKEEKEEVYWQKILRKNSIALYDEYLEKYPIGKYSDIVLRLKLELEKHGKYDQEDRNVSEKSIIQKIKAFVSGIFPEA